MTKKIMTYFRTLSVAFLATATLAACSSSDDSIIDEQPVVTPTAPTTYTMTVQATKGDGTTRGLSLDDDVLNVKWNQDEEVKVVQDNTVIGTLKAAASNDGTTTLTGTLTGFKADFPLVLYLHSNVFNYEGQTGVLLNSEGGNSIEDNYDYAYCDVAVNQITVEGSKVTVNNINFESVQAIVKFTLVYNSGTAIQATSLTIEDKAGYIYQQMDIRDVNNNHRGPITIEPTTPTNVIYAAICDGFWQDNEYTLTATDADGKTYSYTKSNIRFEIGKYYDVTVKIFETHQYVDLGLSVKWATTNVGAESETDCGDYYAWAATTVTTPYNWANTPYYEGLYNWGNIHWSKYTDSGSTLESVDDAATFNWGSKWRMPTMAEWQELFDNCTLDWVANYNGSGVKGVLATSKKEGYTDQSIFLPVSGSIIDEEGKGKTELNNVRYWSSTLSLGYAPDNGESINLRNTPLAEHSVNFSDRFSDKWRCNGMPIRPVQP